MAKNNETYEKDKGMRECGACTCIHCVLNFCALEECELFERGFTQEN